MGIGRASMLAVSVMASFGIEVEQAFEWVAEARGLPVPDTGEQREWVAQFSRSLKA